MKRFAVVLLVFVGLLAGAWFALRPPEMPNTPAAQASVAPPVTEARAAALPSASKLGTSAVLSIDPRSMGARGSAAGPRNGLFTEYLAAKSYKALFDRLSGSAEGETPEGRYVLYDILRKCATITERTTRQPLVRTAEQRRDQFVAAIPENDPIRDKRIAAFDEVATNRCAGMEGVSVTQSSLNKLLADAAAAGDPKAQALTLEQSLWAARRAEGRWRSDVAPTDDQVSQLRNAIMSRDPEAMLIAGRVLSTSWHDFSLRIGDNQVVEQRSFNQAWALLACDYGYPCGENNQRVLSACAYQGHCNAQSLPDYIYYYGASPYDSQLLSQYREVLRTAIETNNWGMLNVVRGPVPAQARATNNPPGPGR
ncbi:MAG TPA: hypothetical protein VM051_07135 [Usitatibacter sp.]|nr:hypothetical protein [Usitatibacter sp.]